MGFPIESLNLLSNMKHEVLEIDDHLVMVTYHATTSDLLNEAKTKGVPLIGTYSVIKHPPHTQPGEYHLHVYDGNNQIFAINQSGRGHDGYHGVRIPNKVYHALKNKYKDWLIPPNQIIESLTHTYILSPISDLSYKEILNEIQFVGSEINLCEKVKGSKIDESLTRNFHDKSVVLEERLRDLFIQSVKRLQ
jgi:hypothetical protein